MNIPFVKMHANGNDFVIIDNRTKNSYLTSQKFYYYLIETLE